MSHQIIHNIGFAGRVSRLVLSVGICLATLSASGPIGWLAVMPLIAIYPGLTAAVGWDPVYAVVASLSSNAQHAEEDVYDVEAEPSVA